MALVLRRTMQYQVTRIAATVTATVTAAVTVVTLASTPQAQAAVPPSAKRSTNHDSHSEHVFDRWTLFQFPGQPDWTAEGYSTQGTDARLSITYRKDLECESPQVKFSIPITLVPIRFADGPYPGNATIDINHTPAWHIDIQNSHVDTNSSPGDKTVRYNLRFTADLNLVQPVNQTLEPAQAPVAQRQHFARIAIPDSGLLEYIDMLGAEQAIAAAQQRCQQQTDPSFTAR